MRADVTLKKQSKQKIQPKNFLKFIIPSILGIMLFMTPILSQGEWTIPIAMMTNSLMDLLGDYLPILVTMTVVVSSLASLTFKLSKGRFLNHSKFLRDLLDVSYMWLAIRVLGGIFALITILEIGPEAIWSDYTGGLLLYELMPILFTVFIFAGLFIPLLLDFGLLEFVGSILKKVMRPIFTLPGRASIDCIASWLGDGTIGVVLTSKQYEDGYYSQREAAVIGTTFSVVSITFCWVIISQVNLSHMFLPFYLTVLVSGIIAAIVLPRIPPLSKKKDEFYVEGENNSTETIPEGYNGFTWGFAQATEKASKTEEASFYIKKGINNVLDMWLGVLPIVMALGTITLIVAEFTSVFSVLGMPFIPLLRLLNIPEAVEASETLVIGFADMFLPAIIGSRIESELTRFVIACVSVTQLIYMSEVGGVIIGSKIPVSFKELFIIFIQRTLITLPIIALIAHMLF
ncbi:YjiH family protein [Alkalicella caledoniensis]